MLDTGQIAGMLEVTRDTVDSYRSRGAMVAPQLYRSRTPLWAAPVVRHWIAGRPSTSARRRAR
ncbi:MarR family transcriptional regulator [Nitriliruptoraceae bacterium ZYF776]|nr:MarR family transcriptional regulator [Profundirhabdus halotolerans]